MMPDGNSDIQEILKCAGNGKYVDINHYTFSSLKIFRRYYLRQR
uniref:Macaca fascicularis brain cDNA clone: QflA-19953, similar to human hypothetical gene supported by AK126318 (LOC400608), mRNA, RefSeq: XM_375475.1 n=1 Tax=Macaca fascicularis TaxID=9541 RepID=I7GCP5_MACFA|nr:unnamed protein product [Macaca fascicularis]